MAKKRRGDDITAWAKDALCRRVPHDWWFSVKPGDAERAKEVCARCPVFDECRAHADHPDTREHYGIWAGETPTERGARRRAERRRRRTPAGTAPRAVTPWRDHEPPTPDQLATRAAFEGTG